jgi:hypothetical protein
MLSRTATGLDLAEHASDSVHRGQKRTGNVRIAEQQAIPHLAQKIFPDMRDRLQLPEPEESAGAFEGVDSPKNTAERLPIAGVFFDRHKIALQAIQIFMTFDQELCENFFHRKAGVGKRASLRRVAQPKRLPKARQSGWYIAINFLQISDLQKYFLIRN